MIEFILMYSLIMQQNDDNVTIIAQYNNKEICENIAKNNIMRPIYDVDVLKFTCVPTHIPIKK